MQFTDKLCKFAYNFPKAMNLKRHEQLIEKGLAHSEKLIGKAKRKAKKAISKNQGDIQDMVDEINDLDEKIAEIEEQKKAIEGQMKERVVRLKTLVNFIGQKVVEEQELDVLLDLISE